MKIIVLDDELASLEEFLPLLVDSDYTFRLFKNDPFAALEYVGREQVDLAIIDVKMPQIDGVTLAERMIAASPNIKIVVVSGYVQNEDEIRNRLAASFAGFFYKPLEQAQLASVLAAVALQTPLVRIRTFGAFDVSVANVAVRFSSSKAKELLALLVDACGAYVSMDRAIGNLWQDKDAEHGKRLYRDAVSRLKLTLKENGIERLVRFERARAVIETRFAECDMWKLCAEGGKFVQSYMPEYDWAMETEAVLHAKYGDTI